MSSNNDFDLLVIGAGSGGVRASRIASSYGAKVAVIEEKRPGGTCVLRGCVPKKLLVYGSQYSNDFKDSIGFGWNITSTNHSWSKLIRNKNNELDRLSKIYSNILENASCKLIYGKASFIDKNKVKVGNEIFSADKILIATGGQPFIPDVEGLQSIAINSDEAMELENLPKKIVIYGSGYIAVEFAGIFNSLGSEVHLVYRADKLLRGFDYELRERFEKEVLQTGIYLHSNNLINKVEGIKSNAKAYLSDNTIIKNTMVLSANGRIPNTDGLGLENIGVHCMENNAIKVNSFFMSNISSIFAIGDVTDRINLTPVALGEGHAFADAQFGGKSCEFSHQDVPTAVFSQPSIATVGISEDEAKEKGIDTIIFTSLYKPLKHTLTGNSKRSFMKLVVEKKTNVVLGAHMLGDDAPEIIQGIAIAIKARLTKIDFDDTLAIHPTSAEEFVTMRKPRDKKN